MTPKINKPSPSHSHPITYNTCFNALNSFINSDHTRYILDMFISKLSNDCRKDGLHFIEKSAYSIGFLYNSCYKIIKDVDFPTHENVPLEQIHESIINQINTALGDFSNPSITTSFRLFVKNIEQLQISKLKIKNQMLFQNSE